MNAVSRPHSWLHSWSQEWWGIYLFKKAPKMLPKFPRCSTSEAKKSGPPTRPTIKTNPVDPMGVAAREESKSAHDAGIHSSLSGLRWRAVSTAKSAGTVPSSSGAAEEPATRVIGAEVSATIDQLDVKSCGIAWTSCSMAAGTSWVLFAIAAKRLI